MNTPLYLGDHAALTPGKPAVINGNTGAALSYREQDQRSMRLAQYLHAMGLRRGDRIAILMENHLSYFEVCWAAWRSGLLVTPISTLLTAEEAAYIVRDSQSQALFASHATRTVAAGVADQLTGCRLCLMVDGVVEGFASHEETIAQYPAQRLAEEWLGGAMMYSSGTTGRPKGILRLPPDQKVAEGMEPFRQVMWEGLGFNAGMVYLSPAPLYHVAPLMATLGTQFFGGTVVFMEKFDAGLALRLIERYRVSFSQWVPTMFVRMLRLPPAQRQAFDLSSHRVALHGAAPCPVEVKRQMIAWWGPILVENYGGSEGNGRTSISSAEWLARPGSVGRPVACGLRICDDEGRELPAGEDGLVYFQRDGAPFEYLGDPEKTRKARHPEHPTWSTLGDIGHVDEAGYLYLTDRQSFMIISGGVNVYPQAIEDALALHPAVADAAVIGVPDAEMGEQVKAIIQPTRGSEAGERLAQELLDFLRQKVARHMVPRSVDFVDELPRLPTGKLLKKVLKERYWHATVAVAQPTETPAESTQP